MRKQKGFDKRFSLAAIIAMVVLSIITFGCSGSGGGGGGGGGGAGGDGGGNFACGSHETPVTYFTDLNENDIPVFTPGNEGGYSFYKCVADGDTVPEYRCYTRNSGPPETSPEIPTAYCGGSAVAPTGNLTCSINGDDATLTTTVTGGIVTNVDFMEAGNTVDNDNTEPYSVVASNLTAGNHTFRSFMYGPNGNAFTNDCTVTVGGIGDPIVTINVPLPGDTIYINEQFPSVATVIYPTAVINSVTFSAPGLTTCTDSTPGTTWNCGLTPTTLGGLTVTVTAYAANGHTGTAQVRVVVISRPIIRPILRIVYGWYMSLYHSMTTNCFYNRPWNFEDFVTCGGPGNLCVMQGELSDYAIAAGNCEWNMTAPSGGGGNPNPSFPDSCDFSLTGYFDSVTGQAIYDDELTSQYVEISYNGGVTWQTLIDTYLWHSWGANYTTLTTAPGDDNIDITINTAIDTDGDGFVNHCPANTPACVADNCILYANPVQTINPCLNRPNPCENDTDNNGIMDGGAGCGF